MLDCQTRVTKLRQKCCKMWHFSRTLTFSLLWCLLSSPPTNACTLTEHIAGWFCRRRRHHHPNHCHRLSRQNQPQRWTVGECLWISDWYWFMCCEPALIGSTLSEPKQRHGRNSQKSEMKWSIPSSFCFLLLINMLDLLNHVYSRHLSRFFGAKKCEAGKWVMRFKSPSAGDDERSQEESLWFHACPLLGYFRCNRRPCQMCCHKMIVHSTLDWCCSGK